MSSHIIILHRRQAVGESIAWSLSFASGHDACFINNGTDLSLNHAKTSVILSDPQNLEMIFKPEHLSAPAKLNCPVILMIDDIGKKEAFDSLDARVAAIIDLSKGPQKLIEKVQQVLENRTDDQNILIQQLIHHKAGNPKKEPQQFNLTVKEKIILRQLREGVHLKMVAHNTGTTYETVRTHVKHIYRKIGVMSASEAVIKAMKMDLD